MREGVVIHMVRDPLTLQNEEIFLSIAVESDMYVTERTNTSILYGILNLLHTVKFLYT